MTEFNLNRVNDTALQLVEGVSVLANTVFRDAEKDFNPGNGRKVGIRLPQPLKAELKTDGNTVQYKSLDEKLVELELTDWAYGAVKVSDADMTFAVRDGGAQILAPIAEGVAIHCEESIAKVMNAQIEAGETRAGSALTISKKEPTKAVAAAAGEFLKRKIHPSEARYLAIGPELLEAFLNVKELTKVDNAGTPDALRNATLGRLHGFTVVASPYITGGIFYSKNGFALGNRAPLAPQGAPKVASSTWSGFSLTTTYSYAPEQTSDVIQSSTFVGTVLLDANRVMACKVAA